MGGHYDYSTPGNINLAMALAMEKQNFVPCFHCTYCTYVAVQYAISIDSVTMEAQRVLCTVALHTSLLTITNTQVFT